MSKGKTDHDHAADETLPEPEPIAELQPEPPAPTDPSINLPPEPEAHPAAPEFYALYAIVSGLTAAVEGLADRVPSASDFSRRLQPVRASLATLWAIAHKPK